MGSSHSNDDDTTTTRTVKGNDGSVREISQKVIDGFVSQSGFVASFAALHIIPTQ